MSEDLAFTIGICAYNEAGAIERSIRSIFDQELSGFTLDKVIVVSSASTDGTDEIVTSLSKEYPEVVLMRQEKREGKNSAVNCYLKAKDTELIVMLNADNAFASEHSLQKLLEPFRDEKAGLVGGHPIPLNSKKTLAGFASNMVWSLHHNIASRCPKIGELIAYRDVGIELPTQYQSDEDFIRVAVESAGYVSVYAPDATVYNRGPETVSDFIKQRLRVNIGQSIMVEKSNFYNPSRDPRMLVEAIFDTIRDLGFHPIKMFASVMMELYCRIKAKKYVKDGNCDLNAWEPVASTKKL
ncbi:MAG: glycosyltransferase [Methanomassiliicoccales archaeon]|nr:glycosyltransferase [Methanomassiliicoccales archaeon]